MFQIEYEDILRIDFIRSGQTRNFYCVITWSGKHVFISLPKTIQMGNKTLAEALQNKTVKYHNNGWSDD